MIQAANIGISFGNHLLFDDVNFTIGRGEKVGLVGRNGSGKTTLLNLLGGQISSDEGTISMPRDYTVGYMQQELSFTGDRVLEEAFLSLRPDQKDDIWRAEKVLSGLGFSIKQFGLNPSELSGGYQVRLKLADTLIAGGNLLLLDEPTNYLDIISIRWLERFLRSWPGELVVITHDRSFMDSVITHTMMIHRNRIRKVSGSTTKMYEQIAKEEEIHEKTRINDEKRQREIEIFIHRFRAKATLARLVQSRIKSLQRKVHLEKLERIETLDFSFRRKPIDAKFILHAGNISFSYTSAEPLFEEFSLTVAQKDRIGIIGKNGKGKSTLLKALAGELQTQGGSIRPHQAISIGYFGQMQIGLLHDDHTVDEELGSVSTGLTKRDIMDVCGAMMFGGGLSEKRIGVLSGGEKSRVLLGKILLTPVNLLILDEPTNHLDMESCDSLMSAIDRFDGAVLIATHNEMFLHTLTARFVVFDGPRPFLFEGSYQDFLDRRGWENEGTLNGSASQERKAKPVQRERRVKRAEIIRERSRALKQIKQRISALEEEIEKGEGHLAENNNALIDASAGGAGERIQRLSMENHRLKTRVEEFYALLEDRLHESEEAAAKFDRLLQKL
ncbi:MAG: ATP-binding cassette domain-containing protein [Spirochaetes bacterium]|nr:ATP-binding cassette domain-containing protein [Spirochaetota bacterium]